MLFDSILLKTAWSYAYDNANTCLWFSSVESDSETLSYQQKRMVEGMQHRTLPQAHQARPKNYCVASWWNKVIHWKRRQGTEQHRLEASASRFAAPAGRHGCLQRITSLWVMLAISAPPLFMAYSAKAFLTPPEKIFQFFTILKKHYWTVEDCIKLLRTVSNDLLLFIKLCYRGS